MTDNKNDSPCFYGTLGMTKSDGSMRYFNIKRSILIGRGAECDIRIRLKTVSRVHCKLNLTSNGEFLFENVSTTTFTIVNNTEVRSKESFKLNDGDIITVAERDFIFRLIGNKQENSNNDNVQELRKCGSDGLGVYTIFCWGGGPATDVGGDKGNDNTCIIM